MPSQTMDYRAVGPADELREASVMPYYLEDLKHRVAVARVGGRPYAFDDMTGDPGCPLSSGLLRGTTIMSQCDGSTFDITSGAVLRGPATASLGIYDVREQDGQIQVRI